MRSTGPRVSKDAISRITEKVTAELAEWASRPLDSIYVAHLSVTDLHCSRVDEDHRIVIPTDPRPQGDVRYECRIAR